MRRDTRAKRDERTTGVRKGFRRHHNTDGRQQIKSGALYRANQVLARKLGVTFHES